MRDDREKKTNTEKKKEREETRQDDINFIDIALLVNINQRQTETPRL